LSFGRSRFRDGSLWLYSLGLARREQPVECVVCFRSRRRWHLGNLGVSGFRGAIEQLSGETIDDLRVTA
jgi:hypothetical protein